MAELTREEQHVFDEALKTGNLSLFTERFFRLPNSGTRFTPEDRVEQYDLLHDAWQKAGKPDTDFEVVLGDVPTTLRVEWDEAEHYNGYPVFLLRHGFLMLPWLNRFISPDINLGLAIAGAGSGKTCSLAIAMLSYCAMYPGFRALNVAPTGYQAELMLGEIEKWCANKSLFRRFIKPSRGAHSLWVQRPYPLITIEVYDGYPSQLMCQTVGRDATGILGSEQDWINCDEAQLLAGISAAEPALYTRLRGTRSTGALRWGKVTWITNPGPNPELSALMGKYQDLIDKGAKDVLVLEGEDSSANIYVTKWQLEKQSRVMSGLEVDRWHGGMMSAAFSGMGISEHLLERCRTQEMDNYAEEFGRHDDVVGLRAYEMEYEPGHGYVVFGDPGLSVIASQSTMNVPVVMVADVTDFLMRRHGTKLVALHWIDGDGSYTPWIDKMKAMMLKYRGSGYYDAGNVQTAFDDLEGAFGGDFNWPVEPIFFSGTIVPKRWSVTILTQLMRDAQFAWPYIKGLWHQARIFDVSKRTRADDLICCLLVLCMAFQKENAFWERLMATYKWEEGEDGQPVPVLVDDEVTQVGDDRHARLA